MSMMTTETAVPCILSDNEEEEVVEDEEEEHRFQESIRKDLFTEFSEATPMKLTRQSVSHNREPMKVFLRVRPFTNNELEEGESQQCMKQENITTLHMRAPQSSFAFKSSQRGFGEMNHKFSFSKIFNEETTQKLFFDETMLATVKDFIDGQNCLVFTYGVTNAGKTYTIQGVPQDGGILPRSLDVIFNSIEDRQYASSRLKPRYFCDVVKLSEKQQKKEQDIKSSVLALGVVNPTPVADQTTFLEGESMAEDSLNSDTSRASYSTANNDSQDSSKLSESKMCTKELDVTGLGNQTFLDEINARIPDDTAVNVDAQGPIKFSVWVSFAEIYNEYMYDLLEPLPKEKKIRRQALKLAEDKHGSIYIKGLKQIQVNTADEAYRILKIGQRNLSIAATKLNHCSSRSHCIFSVKVLRVVDVNDPHVARVSHLSFCDLAGSERYTRTQNTGDRLKEAGNINTSLLTLGKCIHALRYNQNHPKAHPKIIPFRESKLTRLFQSFFLGKGKASMVVNVNQCASGFDETMHVLKFSAIAKQVTTITSKLDNRWKEPPKKATRPLRNVSLALNQALDTKVKGQRPSVPWATPGTIAQVMKETGHVRSVEDTVFEEDEEEDDEVEEIESDSDVADTPVAKKENNSKIQSELLAVIEILKQKLVEEKAENVHLETRIREEVCQEMAEQLVEIEQDYNERLEEDKQRAEEVYEKRLEIYAKSVKKPRKRGRVDDDATDSDEMVSVSLLAAEQNKVRDRDAQIEKLTSDLESTEQSLKEFEDKMHDKVQELSSTVAKQQEDLQEKDQRYTAKVDELMSLNKELTKQIKDMSSQISAQSEKLEAKEETSKMQESHLEASKESLQREIAELMGQLEHLGQKLADDEGKIQMKEKEMEEDKKYLQEQVAELTQTIAGLHERREEQEKEGSSKEAQLKAENQELLEKISVLNAELEEQTQRLVHDEEKIVSKGKEIEDSNALFQTQVTELKTTINSMQEERADSEKELKSANEELVKKIAELTRQLEEQGQKSAAEEENAKTKEKEVEESKKILQDQVAEHTEMIASLRDVQEAREKEAAERGEESAEKEAESAKREAGLKAANKELLQKVSELEEKLGEQAHRLEDDEESIKTKEKQMEDSKNKQQKQVTELNKTVASLRKERDEHEKRLKAENKELSEKVSELEEKLGEQAHRLEDDEESIKTKEKQMEDSKNEQQKQVTELNETIASLRKERDEHEKRLKADNKELSEKVSELEEKLGEQAHRLEDDEESIKTKEKQMEDSKNEQQKQVTELNETIASLRKERDEHEKRLKAENKELSEKVSELQTVVDVQTAQLKGKTEGQFKGQEAIKRCQQLSKQVSELEAELEAQQEELRETLEASEAFEKKIEELALQRSKDLEERAVIVEGLEDEVNALKDSQKQLEQAKIEIQERDAQIEDLYQQLEEGKEKIKHAEETMATQLCAELKSHEDAQKELRTEMLQLTSNRAESSELIQEQEAAMEELKTIVEKQQIQIETLEGSVSKKNEELKKLETELSTASKTADVEEDSTQTDETETSDYTTGSSSSDDVINKHETRTMSSQPSTTSLASTISTTSTEEGDDSVIIIEPEDQKGYKAGRLSRVEIDATPLQKKNSRKGRSTRSSRTTKTSLRASKKRGGEEKNLSRAGPVTRSNSSSSRSICDCYSESDEVTAKRQKAEDAATRGRTRRATRTSSKASLHEEIENLPEEGNSPSSVSLHNSGQRRGPLARINEYLQNSPIGKSAKRLVDTATGAVSPAPQEDVLPPTPSPPKAVEMATFVPSMAPDNKRRKRKLYKTDISAPLECSPFEIGSLGEAKPTEGTGAIITRKLRSRTKKY